LDRKWCFGSFQSDGINYSPSKCRQPGHSSIDISETENGVVAGVELHLTEEIS
jgi:hypothetical protein